MPWRCSFFGLAGPVLVKAQSQVKTIMAPEPSSNQLGAAEWTRFSDGSGRTAPDPGGPDALEAFRRDRGVKKPPGTLPHR